MQSLLLSVPEMLRTTELAATVKFSVGLSVLPLGLSSVLFVLRLRNLQLLFELLDLVLVVRRFFLVLHS